jgi:uncharacterized protein YlxW (UPF0749 family)
MRNDSWHIPITVVFLCLGILLSLQFHSQIRFASDLTLQNTETLVAMFSTLSEKRNKLALEITDLESQFKSQTENQQDEKKLEESINLKMEKLRIVNGTIPLKGPGVIITFEEKFQIVDRDLIYLVNELRGAGAEAISINGHRITNQSYICDVDDGKTPSYTTVNDNKLEYPIVVKAIGDPNTLDKWLTFPGGFMDYMLSIYETFPRWQKVNNIGVPGIKKPSVYHYLHEYKSKE